MEAPEKLRPCPFCGGEPNLVRTGNWRQSMVVSCSECGCTHECGDIGPPFQWNTRASTMPGELVEELREVAAAWLRHIDRQKERTETLVRAASLAKAGKLDEARRLKSQVDSAPRVYDGANMEPVMRKFKAWAEGRG